MVWMYVMCLCMCAMIRYVILCMCVSDVVCVCYGCMLCMYVVYICMFRMYKFVRALCLCWLYYLSMYEFRDMYVCEDMYVCFVCKSSVLCMFVGMLFLFICWMYDWYACMYVAHVNECIFCMCVFNVRMYVCVCTLCTLRRLCLSVCMCVNIMYVMCVRIVGYVRYVHYVCA